MSFQSPIYLLALLAVPASVAIYLLADRRRRGCFMGNAMSELAGRCKETAARTGSNKTTTEEALYRTLLRGKREGELKNVRDLRAVARFLYSSMQGLMLTAKPSV